MSNFWAKKKAIEKKLADTGERIASAVVETAQETVKAAKDALHDVYDTSKEAPTATSERAQYRDKFFLMNKTELALYKSLTEAAPALLVFSQVSMSQLFHIDRYKKGNLKALGEIGRKSVDFLLCRADDSSIVLAIELNGPKHEEAEQKAGDEKKRIALEEAGIPLVVLYPDQLPDVAGIRKLLAPHMVDRKKYEAERNQRLGRD
jgi:hypothetical protein